MSAQSSKTMTPMKEVARSLSLIAALLMLIASIFSFAPTASAQDNSVASDIADALENGSPTREQNDALNRVRDAVDALNGDQRASDDDVRVIGELFDAITQSGGAIQNNPEAYNRLLDDVGGQNNLDRLLNNDRVSGLLIGARSGVGDVLRAARASARNGGSGVAGSALEGENANTYSTLLASVIFSRGKNDVVDSATVSMADLARYPVAQDSVKRYGDLDHPDNSSDVTPEGGKLAGVIPQLFQYHWLTSSTGDSKDADQNNDGGAAEKVVLTLGTVGASLYDGITRIMTWLNDALSNVNIVNILGLSSDGSSDDTSVIVRSLSDLTERTGLNSSIRSLEFISAAVIGAAFMIVLIRSVSAGRQNTWQDGSVKNWTLRIFVIMLTIPFATVFTSTINSLTYGITHDNFNAATAANEDYVVDSLSWAAATNGSMGPAGYGVNSDLTPTNANVAQMNRWLNANSNIADGGVDAGGSAPSASASKVLTDYSNHSKFTVVDYFNAISSANVDSRRGESMAVAINPVRYSGPIGSDAILKPAPEQFLFNPHFLETRPFDLGEEASSSGSNDSGDDAQSGSAEVEDRNDSIRQFTPRYYSGDDAGSNAISGDEISLACEKMSCTPLSTTSPGTYIYGAVHSGNSSEETRSYANFIAGEGTHQNLDPTTGEKPSKEEIEKALNENAATIARWNMYAGVSNVEGMPSLSTQSMAFLLQSVFDGDTLHYYGYQTSQSTSGNRPADIHKVEFNRYTIPNTGPADLSMKIMGLALLWIMAGIISVVAIFAVLKTNVLAAVANMFKSFFSALFTGNVGGLLKYSAYYGALRLSFAFASAAITFGIYLSNQLAVGLGATKLVSSTGNLLPTKQAQDCSTIDVGCHVENVGNGIFGAMNSIAASVVTILVCIVLTAILVWPAFTLSTRNGVEKVSIIRLIVSVPYMLADNLAEKIDSWTSKLGHRDNSTDRMYNKGSGKMRSAGDLGREAYGKVGSLAKDAGKLAVGSAVGAGAVMAASKFSSNMSDAKNAASLALGGGRGSELGDEDLGVDRDGKVPTSGEDGRDGLDPEAAAAAGAGAAFGAAVGGRTGDEDEIDADRDGERLYDEQGRLINADGQLIDENGNLINEDGQLIDDQGRLVNEDGQLVDENGNLIDEDGNLIDPESAAVDEGAAVDETVDGEGVEGEDDGSYTDKFGNTVGADGQIASATPESVEAMVAAGALPDGSYAEDGKIYDADGDEIEQDSIPDYAQPTVGGNETDERHVTGNALRDGWTQDERGEIRDAQGNIVTPDSVDKTQESVEDSRSGDKREQFSTKNQAFNDADNMDDVSERFDRDGTEDSRLGFKGHARGMFMTGLGLAAMPFDKGDRLAQAFEEAADKRTGTNRAQQRIDERHDKRHAKLDKITELANTSFDKTSNKFQDYTSQPDVKGVASQAGRDAKKVVGAAGVGVKKAAVATHQSKPATLVRRKTADAARSKFRALDPYRFNESRSEKVAQSDALNASRDRLREERRRQQDEAREARRRPSSPSSPNRDAQRELRERLRSSSNRGSTHNVNQPPQRGVPSDRN